MSNKISKNLVDLLNFLIQEQINDESATIIKEIINYQIQNKTITKKSLKEKYNLNKPANKNNFELLLERLINLDYIEIKGQNEDIILKIDNMLNILLYSRYCYYFNSIYGAKYLKIIEYMLEYGYYSFEDYQNQKEVNFTRNDLDLLKRDGLIITNNHMEQNNINNIDTKSQEIFKINYNLLNRIIFKEYIINFYRNFISMNYQFYEIFKKVIKSENFSYELKDDEKTSLDGLPHDNLDYDKLLIKENNKVTINKDIVKYDLFYNSIEKIIKLIFSSKHIRIIKIIQRNQNLNIYQISQTACLKALEVEEILDELVNKVKIINKIRNDEDSNNTSDKYVYCLREINSTFINMMKDNIYGIIKNIKFELKDKLKELQGRISKETEIQYINKYYSLVNTFSEILNYYNFLFENNSK